MNILLHNVVMVPAWLPSGGMHPPSPADVIRLSRPHPLFSPVHVRPHPHLHY
jgi:hypothetical protein